MQRSRVRTAIIVLVALSGTASAQVSWENDIALTGKDKAAIIALAQKSGIAEPRRASLISIHPIGQMVVVKSGVSTNGKRRSWLEIDVCRIDWECYETNLARVGRWVIASRAQEREAWRVDDKDWYVDVTLSKGVSYKVAERIVVAIHRNDLVDRLPPSSSMPIIKANNIRSVTSLGTEADEYEVEIDGGGATGVLLRVRLRNGKVELYQEDVWIA